MTEDLKRRIGFAVGAGLVPGIMGLVIIRIILNEWGLAFLTGAAVWLIVGAIFWGKYAKRR